MQYSNTVSINKVISNVLVKAITFNSGWCEHVDIGITIEGDGCKLYENEEFLKGISNELSSRGINVYIGYTEAGMQDEGYVSMEGDEDVYEWLVNADKTVVEED